MADSRPTSHLARPWMLVLALCIGYLAIILAVNQFDPLAFVTLGTQFTEGDPAGTEGYDGQFVYFIAAEPFTAPEKIDVPAYRYQRILLPALGRLLALGQAPLVPWALVLINLTALVIGTAILEHLLVEEKASRWYALSYGLFGGVFMAVRLSLNEPLAYALALAAVWMLRHDRLWFGGALLGLAALGKETALLFTAAYLLWLLWRRQWIAGLKVGVPAVGPFAVWQLVLIAAFGSPGIGSGGAMATAFEIIPFNGFLRILTDSGSVAAFALFAVLLLPSTIFPALWGLWHAVRDFLRGAPHVYTALLAVNAAVIPFVPFSTYREPLGMLRFLPGLVIATVLYTAHTGRQRALRYTTLWIVSLLLVFASG